MTFLELQAKKADLAKRILNIESEQIINELSQTVKRLTSNMPGNPTDEELRDRARRVSASFENGELDKFISLEELQKRHTL